MDGSDPRSSTMTTKRPRVYGRWLQLGLGVYATAVFAVMWVGFALALISQPDSLDEAWQSLRGLPPVPQVAAWILFLPIAVGLWAWTSDLHPAVAAAVVVGLVLWTLAAVSGLIRAVARR
jgi:hypothetical protein